MYYFGNVPFVDTYSLWDEYVKCLSFVTVFFLPNAENYKQGNMVYFYFKGLRSLVSVTWK